MTNPFLKTTALCLLVGFSFSNCASIVSKTSYPVSIRSNPRGASITVTDKKGIEVYKGSSPTTVSLKSGAGFFSKAQYQVKFTLAGYDEKIVPINFKLNGWYFGNIFLGGFVGMLIVDPATGAMWKIEEPVVDEELSKTTASATNSELKIIDIADVSEDAKAKLVRIK